MAVLGLYKCSVLVYDVVFQHCTHFHIISFGTSQNLCPHVDSGYCMQEFDAAFHHHILEKRKKRLVVLMALDRPNDLYANDASDTVALRHYLRQYTYIDYTADDWLDNLLYALPVSGLLEQDQSEMNLAAVDGVLNVPDDDAMLLGHLEIDHQRHLNSEDTDLLLAHE